MARCGDVEYMQSAGTFSAKGVSALQRCCEGVERGRLGRRALKPSFDSEAAGVTKFVGY